MKNNIYATPTPMEITLKFTIADSISAQLTNKSILNKACVDNLIDIYADIHAVQDIFTEFKNRLHEFELHLHKSLITNDKTNFCQALHKIMGLSEQLGAERLSELILFLRKHHFTELVNNIEPICTFVENENRLLKVEIDTVFRSEYAM